jgi:hypothetical protein
MTYLSITSSLAGEAGLAEYVCTYVFIVVFSSAVGSDFDPEDYE